MGKPEELEQTEEFKLVGFNRFVRSNPRSDRFPVHSFHHVEFWTADATTAASRFSFSLGLPIAARSDLSTSNFSHCSLLVGRGCGSHSPFSLLFTAPHYFQHFLRSRGGATTFDKKIPTIFLEIIQRIGCMTKDELGKEYQKGGCGGFGKGNVSELFKSLEEYNKSLESKQQLKQVSTS